MAVDFQVVFPQESIKLNNVRYTRVGGIHAIRVSGEDFRAVDEVVINDVPSPDVIVLNPRELVAQLPEMMQRAPDVHSVSVLSNRFTVSPRSLIRFRIGSRPGKVRGILRLVQLFTKLLFTTPGSDIFNKSAGGGILSKVGATFGKNEGNNLVTDFVVAVTRTQRQMIAMQGRDMRAPRDERLLSATVTGTQYDKLQQALYFTVELTSQAGRSAVTNFEV
jgi:hypothetical protein